MSKGFVYGRVVKICSTTSSENGNCYKLVNRVHERGYSQTKLIWKYSANRGRLCWCTVYNIESSKEI